MSMPKGKKVMRGIPQIHEELKAKHSIWFTPTSWEKLQRKAIRENISVSEILEKIVTEL
jgi:cytidylate kinase